MHPCPNTTQSLSAAWLDAVDDPLAAQQLAAHRATCAPCDATLTRLERQASVIASLERFTPPDELQARVAAEFGVAQVDDRVATLLGGLTRHRAPAVLDRLVEESLNDPAADLARRMVGRLPRKVAPGDLPLTEQERTERELVGAGAGNGAPGGRRRLFAGALLGAGLLTAGAWWSGLLNGSGAGSAPESGGAAQATPSPTPYPESGTFELRTPGGGVIEVVHHDDLGEFLYDAPVSATGGVEAMGGAHQ